MRALIQRVRNASVSIGGRPYSAVGAGMLVLLGVADDDGEEDARWLAAKIAALRIFDDQQGVMNLNIEQVSGEIMVVSQFTLMASTRRGNRPSYIRAAREDKALRLYEYFLSRLSEQACREVSTGAFGADMQVALVNDGPVTIWIDSHLRE